MTATNTFMTFLMKKGDSAYEKLVDIKDYPDLRPAKDTLETTTLSDRAHTYIDGLINQDGSMSFTVNLDKTMITTIKALEGTELDLAVWMGGTDDGTTVTPTGDICKIGGKGKVFLSIAGKGTNEVREGSVNVTPTTPWDFITD